MENKIVMLARSVVALIFFPVWLPFAMVSIISHYAEIACGEIHDFTDCAQKYIFDKIVALVWWLIPYSEE